MDTETLAKLLHEAGREAVLTNKVVKKDGNPIGQIKFIEWDELKEEAKEGRRIQARFLLDKLEIFTTEELTQRIATGFL